MRTCFRGWVWPDVIVTCLTGTPSQAANTFTTASLAFPFSGAADTCTLIP